MEVLKVGCTNLNSSRNYHLGSSKRCGQIFSQIPGDVVEGKMPRVNLAIPQNHRVVVPFFFGGVGWLFGVVSHIL